MLMGCWKSKYGERHSSAHDDTESHRAGSVTPGRMDTEIRRGPRANPWPLSHRDPVGEKEPANMI